MKPAFKYPLLALGLLVLIAPILYVLAVCAALKSHAKVDEVVFGGKRVQEAICDYARKNGRLPASLKELRPEFLKAIPSMPAISRVDYHLSSEGKEWTLDLYWTNRRVPLVYRRTNADLSREDAKRLLYTENGCYVPKVH